MQDDEDDPATRALCDTFERYSGQADWQRGQWIDTEAPVYELPILERPVRCFQRHEDNLNLGITGGTVWDGAVVLSKFLEYASLCYHQNTAADTAPEDDFPFAMDLCGKRCVELGAGTGLVGLCAASLGAHVIITDQQEHLQLMQQNAEANKPLARVARGFVKAAELNWGAVSFTIVIKTLLLTSCVLHHMCLLLQKEPLPPLFGEKYGVQLILASDVVYHEEVVEILMQTIVKLFSKYGDNPNEGKREGGIAAIICFELRHAEVTELFLKSAYTLFDCKFIPLQHQHPEYHSSCIAMVKLTPKKAETSSSKKASNNSTRDDQDQALNSDAGSGSTSIFVSDGAKSGVQDSTNSTKTTTAKGGKMSKSERRKMKAKAKQKKQQGNPGKSVTVGVDVAVVTSDAITTISQDKQTGKAQAQAEGREKVHLEDLVAGLTVKEMEVEVEVDDDL